MYYDDDFDYEFTEADWAYAAEQLGQQDAEIFRTERLPSYYLNHPELAHPAFDCLNESRQLQAQHPAAAVFFATSAIEQAIKTLLLGPLVYGIVDSESVAAAIVNDMFERRSWSRFHGLLSILLAEYGGLNLFEYKRQNEPKKLWGEIKEAQNLRNKIVHEAHLSVTKAEAALAIAVASELLETLFPAVLTRFDVHLDIDHRLCNRKDCRHALSQQAGE